MNIMNQSKRENGSITSQDLDRSSGIRDINAISSTIAISL